MKKSVIISLNIVLFALSLFSLVFAWFYMPQQFVWAVVLVILCAMLAVVINFKPLLMTGKAGQASPSDGIYINRPAASIVAILAALALVVFLFIPMGALLLIIGFQLLTIYLLLRSPIKT